ncbi:MAG: HAMP domain-containing sensor histidine kinase [Thermoanaerobaculia bacterium]
MFLSLERQRALRIAFIAILFISAGEVVWWMLDQRRLVRWESERIAALHDANRQAAERLLAGGEAPELVAVLFPALDVKPSGVAVAPRAFTEIEREHARRLRQYLWEGGFFLVVLGGCVAVISRTLAAEAQLRRRQQNFIAAVTHELKSPIASLQLAAETIALRRPEPARLDALIKRMRGDIRRLEDMVGGILDTATLEAGRPHLRKERLPLARLVAAVAEEFAERAAERAVKLSPSVPAALEIAADPAAANTVLRNLVENALRASAAAGAHQIRLTGRARGGFVELEVADDGVGFEPAEAEKLFEKFYRPGDELRRTTKGTGLGLYVVRRFVELERGWVTAYSPGPGRGATFTVAWPAASPDAADGGEEAS